MPAVGPRELKHLTPPGEALPYVFTARDAQCLELLAAFRYLTARQLHQCLGGSERNLGRRLYLMWRDGLVERPAQQAILVASHFHFGDTARVYGLTRKGARVLAERGVPLAHKLDWTFRPGTTRNLLHTLDVATTMISFRRGAARLDATRFVDHADLVPHFPEATRSLRRPFTVSVNLVLAGQQVRMTNVPDRLFSLHLSDGTRFNWALEQDRGTETMSPERLSGKSTIRRKQTVFFEAFKQNRYRELWGFERLRVLFVTTGSDRRIEGMIRSQLEVTNGRAAGMFLYSTTDRIAELGALGPAWTSSEATGLSLLPSPLVSSSTMEVA